MFGLKRGTVIISDHQSEWTYVASQTISELKNIFGEYACDIQHIGSTAIPSIKAKPIIDIAAGVRSFSDLAPVLTGLEKAGWQKKHNRFSSDLLYVREENNIRTHQLHILIYGCEQWHNYIDFRDYMNAFPEKAKAYEVLKEQLVLSCGEIQTVYTDGKQEFMRKFLAEARAYFKNRN